MRRKHNSPANQQPQMSTETTNTTPQSSDFPNQHSADLLKMFSPNHSSDSATVSHHNTPQEQQQDTMNDVNFVESMDINWSAFTNLHDLQHLEDIMTANGTPTASSTTATSTTTAPSHVTEFLNDYSNFIMKHQQEQQKLQLQVQQQVGSKTASPANPDDTKGTPTFSEPSPGFSSHHGSISFPSDGSSFTGTNFDNPQQPEYISTTSFPPSATTNGISTLRRQPTDGYTPLISPAVTPLEKAQVISHHKKIGFSPLTSPALEFQQSSRFPNNSTATSLRQKRKDVPTNISPPLSNSEDQGTRSTYKRSKTPVTTPLMAPSNSSSSTKSRSSPSVKPNSSSRRSSYKPKKSYTPLHTSTSSTSVLFEGMPDDLMLPPPPPDRSSSSSTLPPKIDEIEQNIQLKQQQQQQQQSALSQQLQKRTPSKKKEENLLTRVTSRSDPSSNSAATPATLMSFPIKKTRSSSKNSPMLRAHDNVLVNPNHDATSAQSSPVILPSSSSSGTLTMQQQIHKNMPNFNLDDPALTIPKSGSHHSSGSSSLKTSPTIQLQDTMSDMTGITATPFTLIAQPMQMPQSSQQMPMQEKRNSSVTSIKTMSDKKVNHKLAEQGRRNRMNVAIQDLDKMIPERLKNEVMVPSKATTVELSCQFITELQKENERLVNEVMRLQRQLEEIRNDNGRATSNNTSSISPMEFVDETNHNNGDSSEKRKA